MRVDRLTLTNQADAQYLAMIQSAFQDGAPDRINAAVAYATHSGVAELTSALGAVRGWNAAQKRWLVGIDFCRSDPAALEHLDDMTRSQVRIYDGAFVVARTGCAPRVSYHPKFYHFRGRNRSAVVAGSGNLSQTGLRVGIEAGVSILDARAAEITSVTRWFSSQWRVATPWGDVAATYADQYSSLKNRQTPMASEDDAVPASAGTRGQLNPEQLRQLSVCRHLWIQAGNLHANRGPGRPGNQLMLKRNSRAFFGFPARDLPRDTFIGNVGLEYDRRLRADCSIRFSNNSMDVLTLPIPGTEGPARYDREILHFEQVGVRKFRLTVAANGDVARWRRRSREIGAAFRMGSRREWGVY